MGQAKLRFFLVVSMRTNDVSVDIANNQDIVMLCRWCLHVFLEGKQTLHFKANLVCYFKTETLEYFYVQYNDSLCKHKNFVLVMINKSRHLISS